jgi:hypothetical protein
MSQAHPVTFAPRWLRCAGCLIEIVLPVPLMAVSGGTVPAAVLGGVVCMHGLHTLVHGKCPKIPLQAIERLRK